MANHVFGISESSPFFGKAVILSFEIFETDHPDLKSRVGSNVDRESLESLFAEMGLAVEIKLNLTENELNKFTDMLASESQPDLFICAILSHGHDNSFFLTSDLYAVNINSIIEKLERSVEFKDTVKIYLANFCRTGESQTENLSDTISAQITPTNTLKIFSTLPGNKSWRSPNKGSFFIEQFVIAARALKPHYEIVTIANTTNKQIQDRMAGLTISALKKGSIDYVTKDQAIHVNYSNFNSPRCLLMPQVSLTKFNLFCTHCPLNCSILYFTVQQKYA